MTVSWRRSASARVGSAGFGDDERERAGWQGDALAFTASTSLDGPTGVASGVNQLEAEVFEQLLIQVKFTLQESTGNTLLALEQPGNHCQ
jgi:hypothetical protein